MVNYQYSSLFLKDSVDKQLNIVSDDGKINITNTELHQEKFELTESLCSESELTFGACEAGMIKFTVSNVFLPMKGKWLTAKMTLDGHEDKPFQIGRYKVYSGLFEKYEGDMSTVLMIYSGKSDALTRTYENRTEYAKSIMNRTVELERLHEETESDFGEGL